MVAKLSWVLQELRVILSDSLGERRGKALSRLRAGAHRSSLIKYCIQPNFGAIYAILYHQKRDLLGNGKTWLNRLDYQLSY